MLLHQKCFSNCLIFLGHDGYCSYDNFQFTFLWMIKRQRWIRGPDLPSTLWPYGPYPRCVSALNSTSIIMIGGINGFVNVFDFNSKKWEENQPGIQESNHLQSLNSWYECSSTITFNKDAKPKLMVLISKF